MKRRDRGFKGDKQFFYSNISKDIWLFSREHYYSKDGKGTYSFEFSGDTLIISGALIDNVVLDFSKCNLKKIKIIGSIFLGDAAIIKYPDDITAEVIHCRGYTDSSYYDDNIEKVEKEIEENLKKEHAPIDGDICSCGCNAYDGCENEDCPHGCVKEPEVVNVNDTPIGIDISGNTVYAGSDGKLHNKPGKFINGIYQNPNTDIFRQEYNVEFPEDETNSPDNVLKSGGGKPVTFEFKETKKQIDCKELIQDYVKGNQKTILNPGKIKLPFNVTPIASKEKDIYIINNEYKKAVPSSVNLKMDAEINYMKENMIKTFALKEEDIYEKQPEEDEDKISPWVVGAALATAAVLGVKNERKTRRVSVSQPA